MSGNSVNRKLPTRPKRYLITPGTDFNDEEYDLTPGDLPERVDKSIEILQIHPALAPHRLRQHCIDDLVLFWSLDRREQIPQQLGSL
jgi:hypothetical protein